MYSLMSMRTIASSSPNTDSASALASSVLPTPVGPRNRNIATGRSRLAQAGAGQAHGIAHCADRLVLADHALVQPLLEPDQPLRSSLVSSATGMPVER